MLIISLISHIVKIISSYNSDTILGSYLKKIIYEYIKWI